MTRRTRMGRMPESDFEPSSDFDLFNRTRGQTLYGRMSESMFDPSDFDAYPKRIVQIPPNWDGKIPGVVFEGQGPYFSTRHDEGEEGEVRAHPFSEDAEEAFPIFTSALRRYQSADETPKVARIDTEETYDDFVCDEAVKELDRQIKALHARIDECLEEGHAPEEILGSREVILGARAVEDLSRARNAGEVFAAMPLVPVDLGEHRHADTVKAWRQGNKIYATIHFDTPEMQHRIATMAAEPNVDAHEIVGCGLRAGINPTTILGALDDLTSVACAKQLTKDLAGCALKVRSREDVRDMEEPLIVVGKGKPSSAALKALVYLQKRADMGDGGANREMRAIRGVAASSGGFIAGLIEEVDRRVVAEAPKPMPPKKLSLLQKYALHAGWAV